jgi:hypothetical protein
MTVASRGSIKLKVIEVGPDRPRLKEEIHFQHPHLSLGQIHAALGCYHDDKAEFDAEIQRSLERQSCEPKPGRVSHRKKLRAMGKLP